MAVFKLRGQSYPITNIGTLGNKIQTCTKNQFASPADDAIAAYCVSRACPSIPLEIASWNSQSDFVFTLDEYEFAIFTGAFSLASLEKRLETTTDSTQRAIISQSIKSIKGKIDNVESEMNQAIADELLKEFQKNNIEDKRQVQALVVIPEKEPELRLMSEEEILEARLQELKSAKVAAE